MGQRMIPDNTSDDSGIVIKSNSLLLIRSSVLKLLMTWFQTKTNLAILFFWPSDPLPKLKGKKTLCFLLFSSFVECGIRDALKAEGKV